VKESLVAEYVYTVKEVTVKEVVAPDAPDVALLPAPVKKKSMFGKVWSLLFGW